jgi:hypothetical protein
VQADPQTVTLQTAPAAAVIRSPAPGSTIPGGLTTFNWNTVTGGTYCLYTGTVQQASCLGTAQPGVQVTLPASGLVYATLGTQVGGVWRYQQSVYTVNPNPSTVPLAVRETTVVPVPNNGARVRRTYYFTQGDPTTISSVSTGVAGFTATLVGVTPSTATIEFQANSSVPTGVAALLTAQSPGGAMPMEGPAPVAGMVIQVEQTPLPVGQQFTIDVLDDQGSNYAMWEVCDPTGACVDTTSFAPPASLYYTATVPGTYSATLYGVVQDYDIFWGFPVQSNEVDFEATGAPPAGMTVSGKVTSTVDNNSGVDGVTITVEPSGLTATTHDGGYYSVGVNSTSDTLTPSLTGYTFNPTSAQANGTPGVSVNFTATPTGTMPNITAISPNSVTQAQGDGNTTYDIYGTNLVSSNAIGPVFCVQGASPGSSTCPSGSGPDPWLTFTVTDQGDTRIEGTITLASNVQAGPRTVYVASPNGNSNTLAFAVQGDLTPYVDQISPGGLDAGQSLSMTITGSNFGPACDASGTPCPGAGIAVCVSGASPCTVSDVTVSNVAWGDTSITATFNAESTASGPYDVVVTSAGASGLGFFAAPNGPQRQSNRGSVVVAVKGNPNLVLIVKSLTAGAAGPPVQMNPGDCAYVNSSNQMPQISAVVNGAQATGSTTYQLNVTYGYTKWSDATHTIQVQTSDGYTTPWSSSQSAAQTWVAPGPSDGSVHVGAATLSWTYAAPGQQPVQQDKFTFKVCGTNADYTMESNALSAPASRYWFAWNLVLHETNASQFCQQAGNRNDGSDYCVQQQNDGLPTFNGSVHGYGILQLDPAISAQDLWDWTQVFADWQGLNDGRPAYQFFNSQLVQYNNYNTVLPVDQRVAPQSDVVYYQAEAGPNNTTVEDTTAVACRFTMLAVNSIAFFGPLYTTDPTQHWFGDAVLIKAQGGAATNYISWLGLKYTRAPHWSISPANSVSPDLVKGVCSCTGPPRLCLKGF